MKTLADLIQRNRSFHRDRVAIIDGGAECTHGALAERALRLADSLARRFGMKQGDRFAILCGNRIEMLEALAMSAVSGFTIVPLNWRLAGPEIARVIEDAAPTMLFVDARFTDVWSQVEVVLQEAIPPRVRIGEGGDYEALIEAGDPAFLGPPIPAETTAGIIYTSGTTGRPKGAMLSQGAMLRGAAGVATMAGHRPTDRMILAMPLFHVGGIIEWTAIQYMGGSCVVLPQFDPEAWFEAVQATRATFAHLAPIMVKRLVESPVRSLYDVSTMARIHYGSAPVPAEDLRRAYASFGPILSQLYGMTENPLLSILLPYQQRLDGDERDARRIVSAGQPYPDAEIWIAAPDGSRCSAGEIGEIMARSPAQFSGYWKNEEATAATMKDGAIATGDLGYLDEDNYLYVVDRSKDVIISGGENIYSREVEDALMAHPGVAEAAVFAVPDPQWGEAVMAHVVLRPDAVADELLLIEHCRLLIAGYKRPRHVIFVDSLPRLPHGKVDKKALRAPYWQGRDRMVS